MNSAEMTGVDRGFTRRLESQDSCDECDCCDCSGGMGVSYTCVCRPEEDCSWVVSVFSIVMLFFCISCCVAAGIGICIRKRRQQVLRRQVELVRAAGRPPPLQSSVTTMSAVVVGQPVVSPPVAVVVCAQPVSRPVAQTL